jgi:hypothetical protein
LATGTWMPGMPETDNVDLGYYDLELEVWVDMPEAAVLVTDRNCPEDFPIKGNLPSRIYHLPDQPTYERTIPEICFADEAAATLVGFRPSRAGQHSE